MARSLASASSQYLETSAFAAMSFPVTIAAWFYSTTTASIQRVATWASASGGNVISSLILNADGAAGAVSNQVYFGGGVIQPASGTYTANTWNHACGVTESDKIRCYLNGIAGSDGTYTPMTLSGTTFSVGRILFSGSGLQYLNGRVCHVAVWNVALTAAEAADLASGCHPRRVRPSALIAHYALGGFEGDYDRDLGGGYHLTPSGSPTFVDQPRIIYPQGPHDVQLAASSPPAATPWLYARRSARIIGGGLS